VTNPRRLPLSPSLSKPAHLYSSPPFFGNGEGRTESDEETSPPHSPKLTYLSLVPDYPKSLNRSNSTDATQCISQSPPHCSSISAPLFPSAAAYYSSRSLPLLCSRGTGSSSHVRIHRGGHMGFMAHFIDFPDPAEMPLTTLIWCTYPKQ
jgi:hypothetical protein